MDSPTGDEAAAQLHADLKRSIQCAHSIKRPILTHLNADSTWLLSLPYPDHILQPQGRSRFNILIDPWLDGPQEDVAGWFSKQWHLAKSSVESISELNLLLFEAEQLGSHGSTAMLDSFGSPNILIDAVVISHEFTDHCHRATLLDLSSDVPVFASQKAAELVRSWGHFTTVIELAKFIPCGDWRQTSLSPLPDWVGISRLVTSRDALYYHSAVVICFQTSQSLLGSADAVIYTPHGVEASSLSGLATALPPLSVLAFLHGLHDVSIAWTKQLNLGAINAIKAQQILRARYWIGTHDEEKPGSGLIAPLLRRKILTVPEALTAIRASVHEGLEGDGRWAEGLTCIELENGESVLLE